jgi:ubiquinone/menaquinone biosynthesis C-methylase UbiE
MNDAATTRILMEYERRTREIPDGFYCWSRPVNLLMHHQIVRSCITLLRGASKFPLNGSRVADVGCGAGTWLLEFIQWGADPHNLAGIDLMPSRINEARQRIPHADLRVGQAAELPWPDKSCDLVTQFTVFSSMLEPAMKQAVAAEMLRVLKPGGVILWFDFRVNNPSNSSVRGIRAREIRELFAGCQIQLVPAILAPPLARLIADWSLPLAELLHAVPFLRTHYTGLIRKRLIQQ